MIKNLNKLSLAQSVPSRQCSSPKITFEGGLEGDELHLTTKSEQAKIAALSQALKYGKSGKDWLFQIVKTETGSVQWVAYDLLWENVDEKVRQKLLKYMPLRSAVGVNYTRLRDLLAAVQWEEADRETKRVMLEAAGREKEGLLNREAMEKFPAIDLQTIDQLWLRYSNTRFGFSVQKRIWQSLFGHASADTETLGQRRFSDRATECINQFAERVGWRVEADWLYVRDLTFNLSAPEGHLPSPSFATPCDGKVGEDHAVLGRWCTAFCFGGVKCGVLFLGWWSLLSRQDL